MAYSSADATRLRKTIAITEGKMAPDRSTQESGSNRPPAHVVAHAEVICRAHYDRCAKHHAAAIFDPVTMAIIASGLNAPAHGTCGRWPGGTARCRDKGVCSKICEHAEAAAIRHAGIVRAFPNALELVHVQLEVGCEEREPGIPSCWQCSKAILMTGRISHVWLWERSSKLAMGCSWHRYTAEEFHLATLSNEGLGCAR